MTAMRFVGPFLGLPESNAVPIYARQLDGDSVAVVTNFMGPPLAGKPDKGGLFIFGERVLPRGDTFLGSFALVVGNGSTEYPYSP